VAAYVRLRDKLSGKTAVQIVEGYRKAEQVHRAVMDSEGMNYIVASWRSMLLHLPTGRYLRMQRSKTWRRNSLSRAKKRPVAQKIDVQAKNVIF
jgi:hypothetical protein